MSDQDQDIIKLYRAGATEEPSAAADAAVLALARAAAAEPPARRSGDLVRRARLPLAIAATVILSFGIVFNAPLLPPEPGSPQAPATAGTKGAPPPPLEVQPTAAQVPAAAPAEAAPRAAALRESPRESPRPEGASARRMAEPAAPRVIQDAAADSRAATPAAPAVAVAPIAPASPPSAEAPAPLANAFPAAPGVQQAPAAPRVAAPAVEVESRARAAPAPMRREMARDAAGGMPGEAALAAAKSAAALPDALGAEVEATLSPAEWLRRIARLRAEDKHAEAEASLARFRERHPSQRIPPEALGPTPAASSRP